MSRLAELSTAAKLSIVFVTAGFIVNLIGFASPYWQMVDQHYSGLWRTCDKYNYCQSYVVIEDWFATSRGCAILGFLWSIVSLALDMLYIFVPVFGTQIVLNICTVACFSTGGFMFLSVLVFAAYAEAKMGWAWSFCVLGVPFYTTAAILLLKDRSFVYIPTQIDPIIK